MTERSEHDSAIADEIETHLMSLFGLEGELLVAWRKVTLIDAPADYRARVAEHLLASADQQTRLAQRLVQTDPDGSS